jgi:putative tryptophan/tyrosine transport system substrate-binding protein
MVARLLPAHGLCLTVLLAGVVPPVAAGSVELLLSGSERLYTRVSEGLQAQLDADVAPQTITLRRATLDQPPSKSAADLTVAVGMAACERGLAAASRAPLLCTLVPKAGFEGITDGRRRADVSAIYLDQPVARQLSLGRLLAPDATRAGLLVGPTFREQRAAAMRLGRTVGLTLDIEVADDERAATRAIQRLVARNDLILPVYDPAALTPSSAKWLLHLAYQKQRPVVGFSRAYVDAGAVAAVFTEPEQIGRQTGQTVARFFQDQQRRLSAPQYPSAFKVAVNRPVASALGLAPPSDAALARAMGQRGATSAEPSP